MSEQALPCAPRRESRHAAAPQAEAAQGTPPAAGQDGPAVRWPHPWPEGDLHDPLLDLPDTRHIIPLQMPDPAALHRALRDGRPLAITALPSGAAQGGAAEPDGLFARLAAPRLDSALLELYRKARADLEEGGASSLCLLIGLLRWRHPGAAGREQRAPLLLLPVSLSRASASGSIQLRPDEDEPRLNAVLLEKLQQDSACALHGLDELLAASGPEQGIAGVLARLRQATAALDGFEVQEEILLGSFPFARQQLWQDLPGSPEALHRHPLLGPLLDTGATPAWPALPAFPGSLDQYIDPSELFTPLPADSTQLTAVLAAAAGHSFVMLGPPGTGKSQTIANLIAHNLALGRRVLFVAEKAAALDVVHRRLREHGLGEFCLELHSDKVRKADVFRQLVSAWCSRDVLRDVEWNRETRRLRQLRDPLNALIEALHRPREPGLTVREALARVIAHADVPHIALPPEAAEAAARAGQPRLLALAGRLASAAAALGDLRGHPLTVVARHDWSPDWQQALCAAAAQAGGLAGELGDGLARLRGSLGLRLPVEGRGAFAAFERLLQLLIHARGTDLAWALRGDLLERLEALNRAVPLLRERAATCAALSGHWPDARLPALDLAALERLLAARAASWWPLRTLRDRPLRDWLREAGAAEGVDPAADLPHLRHLQRLHRELQALAPRLGDLPHWQGHAADPDALARLGELAWQLRSLPAALASDAAQLAALHEGLRRLLADPAAAGRVSSLAMRCQSLATDLRPALERLAELLGGDSVALPALDERGLAGLVTRCTALQQHAGQLQAWCAWRAAVREAAALGLAPLATALETGCLPLSADLSRVLEINCLRAWLAAQFDADPALRDFAGEVHEQRITEFRAQSARVRAMTAEYIRTRIRQQRNDREAGRHSRQFAVLRRALEQPDAAPGLARLLAEAPQAIAALAPCLLMSPQSVARYLPAGQASFDLVIFDEASQVGVREAIGAIARGRQLVVVGDPRQLPPTRFFSAARDAGSGVQSILDALLAAGLPTLKLGWHYRSRHESLIAFSNHHYYQGELLTFPSPATADTAVSLVRIDGCYERGASQTNRAEAEAVVAEIRSRLQGIEPGTLSLGVVTFNQKQQTLILDLLEAARRDDPALDRHFDETLVEPVFVKNLEAVQGDERDLILFSTTFGPDRQGRLSLNFGPLNQRGGERRLNVAITRARRELRVFTSLDPQQTDFSRSSAPGVRDLGLFLAFAARGVAERPPAAPAEMPPATLEATLARALAARGWTVHAQIGATHCGLDLAVVDPAAPQRYLAAIECDGGAWRRTASAADREAIRRDVLRGLGWDVLRLWSIDYWRDPQGSLERLDRQLRDLLARRQVSGTCATGKPGAGVAA